VARRRELGRGIEAAQKQVVADDEATPEMIGMLQPKSTATSRLLGISSSSSLHFFQCCSPSLPSTLLTRLHFYPTREFDAQKRASQGEFLLLLLAAEHEIALFSMRGVSLRRNEGQPGMFCVLVPPERAGVGQRRRPIASSISRPPFGPANGFVKSSEAIIGANANEETF